MLWQLRRMHPAVPDDASPTSEDASPASDDASAVSADAPAAPADAPATPEDAPASPGGCISPRPIFICVHPCSSVADSLRSTPSPYPGPRLRSAAASRRVTLRGVAVTTSSRISRGDRAFLPVATDRRNGIVAARSQMYLMSAPLKPSSCAASASRFTVVGRAGACRGRCRASSAARRGRAAGCRPSRRIGPGGAPRGRAARDVGRAHEEDRRDRLLLSNPSMPCRICGTTRCITLRAFIAPGGDERFDLVDEDDAALLGRGGVEELLDVLLGLADPFAEHVGGRRCGRTSRRSRRRSPWRASSCRCRAGRTAARRRRRGCRISRPAPDARTG